MIYFAEDFITISYNGAQPFPGSQENYIRLWAWSEAVDPPNRTYKVHEQIDQLADNRSTFTSSSRSSRKSSRSARAKEKAHLAALLVEQRQQQAKLDMIA